MGEFSPVPIPRTWNITSAANLQTTYPAAYYQGRVAFVNTPPNQKDQVYYSMERITGVIEWVRIGEVGETDIVAALPAPSADLEGDIVTLNQGVGVRDEFYICIKDETEAYVWVQIGEIGETAVVGALPAASVINEGTIITLNLGAGVRDELYISIKNEADVYQWVQIGKTDVVTALPVAVAADEGKIITLFQGPGVRSISYICLKSDADVYSWVTFADGGP